MALQNGAQRMQAQQQAVAAKQAEMQQQLGAAMMASYPGYMLAPYGMVRRLFCRQSDHDRLKSTTIAADTYPRAASHNGVC